MRLSLDFPDRLKKLVVLDIMPTYNQIIRLVANGAYGISMVLWARKHAFQRI